jgi:hypothetical protein
MTSNRVALEVGLKDATGRTTGDPESPRQVDVLPDSSPPTIKRRVGMYSVWPLLMLSFMNLGIIAC